MWVEGLPDAEGHPHAHVGGCPIECRWREQVSRRRSLQGVGFRVQGVGVIYMIYIYIYIYIWDLGGEEGLLE